MSRTPSRLFLATLVAAWLVTSLASLALAQERKQAPAPKPQPLRNDPGDAKILKALDEDTAAEFPETSLDDVIIFWKDKHHIPIEYDQKALMEAGVSSDQPTIRRDLKNIKLRSALWLVLRDMDLTYVIHEEVLLITTKTAAESMHEVVVYPVADLVTDSHVGPIRTNSAYQGLADLISATVAPHSWEYVGGSCPITPFPASGLLVIKQTQQVHTEIKQLLAAMRAARQEQDGAHRRGDDIARDSDATFVVVYQVTEPEVRGSPNTTTEAEGAAAKAQAEQSANKQKDPNAYAERLAKMMMDVVDPDSWKHAKGQGTIHAVGGRLVVRNTQTVQEQVAALLRELR